MSFDILNLDEVQFENISFKNVNDTTQRLIDVNYNYKSNTIDKIRIATPWIDILSITDKTSLLSLKVMSNEPKMHSIYEFIKKFDKFIIDSCKSKSWFDSSMFSKIRYKKSILKSSSVEEANDDTIDGWIYPVIRCFTNTSEAFSKKGNQLILTKLHQIHV